MASQNGIKKEGSQDVEMTDAADTGAAAAANGGSGGPGSDAPILNSVEQSNLHTSLTFEVKPDPASVEDKPQSSVASSSPAAPARMAGKTVPKKKGMAATKKASKRPKTTRTKHAKKRNPATGSVQDGGDEDSSDDEIDNGPYCICRGPDDHRWMISCDVCEDWFHGECIHIDKELGEKLIERFVCPNCTDGIKNYTKYKKTCSLDGCTNPARLYGKEKDRSVFCCNEHCDAWWAGMIAKLPTRAASKRAIEVLTQEDFMGLLSATALQGGWKIGDAPFGNIEGLWDHGLPTRSGVLSDEEQDFLKSSAAERLALGNEIVQYKKMMQLIDWANQRRQSAIEAGKFAKESCGYDTRLDVVSVRHQFVAWVETPEGQAPFTAGKLEAPLGDGDGDQITRGMCEKKRCKTHSGWYKILMSAVRHEIKEAAEEAAEKLEREDGLRQAAEARYERRQLEHNSVEVL